MKKYLWIAVTADELELPIAVADSQSQLAEILGIKLDTLRRNFFLHQSGTYTEWKKYKIIKLNTRECD